MSNRLYSAAKRKSLNLEKLKRKRELELMSEVKQKPSICKKSESILSQAKMREFSAAKMKQDS